MKQLFYGLLICFLTLVALATIAVSIGHQRTQTFVILELEHCGSAICYLGIMPGTTSWDDGMMFIRQADQIEMSEHSDLVAQNRYNPRYIVGFLSGKKADETDVFIEINLAFSSAAIYAGDIIQKFGTPCYVTPSNGSIILGYENTAFLISSKNNQLTPNSYLIRLVVRLPRPCSIPDSPLASNNWRGFRRYPKS
ncbi:MAG: hypothetical protein U0528_06270 [Anaerolineae bacterium]